MRVFFSNRIYKKDLDNFTVSTVDKLIGDYSSVLHLEQFKEAINTECQARDVKVQESLKRNLSHLSAFVQNNQSKNIEVHNLVAGDDVLNGDEQHNINSSVSEGPSLDDI